MPDHISIAMEGHNCWRRVHADRLTFLVDGESYFGAVKAALLRARQSVIILGWEFDGRVRLDRRKENGVTETVGGLLRMLVRTRPELHVHVLIWDSALIYSFDRELLPVLKHDWLSHPRLHFHLDDSHPWGASHHQKVVVVDDRVAFLGGLDISARRWDSRAHDPTDCRRTDPGFPSYVPYHDVQTILSGEAARALGELARGRWRRATGRRLPRPLADGHDPWPADLPPDIEDVVVALARTTPPWEGEPPVREVENLFIDMVAVAQDSIYVENQYFTSRTVARVLARRLREDTCPEIAVVTSGFSTGFIERSTMGAAGARLRSRLQAYDRHGRLGFYAPTIHGRFLKVHAKVMVVDDSLLRVGSANLNNRSMGLDTECDLLLEAGGQARIARAIAAFRDGLLGEHLGMTPSRVGEELRRDGLHATIAHLGSPERRLEPLQPVPVSNEFLPDTDLLDPDGPVETMLMEALPASPGGPPAARFISGIGTLALLSALAIAWQWLPHAAWPAFDSLVVHLAALRGDPASPVLVAGVFLLTGLTGVPIFLLVTTAGSVFGAWPGGLYALLGVLASAAFSYSLGRALGRDQVRHLTGSRASRISRVLLRHGIVAVAMLRVLPVASFTVVNLMAGATRLSQIEYFTATLVGLAPMIIGFSIFGDLLANEIRQPDALTTGMLAALTVLLAAGGVMLFGRMSRAAPAGTGGPR